MEISVIVVSWNVREHLDRCLRSILAAAEEPGIDLREVIVVDNASSDGTPSRVREHFPDVLVIENETNRGFAAACNQGIELTGGAGVLLLNPDAELAPGALAHLAEALTEDPAVAAAGPRIVGPDGGPHATCRRFPTLATGFLESTIIQDHVPDLPHLRRFYLADQELEHGRDVEWLVGACLLIRRAALDEVGGLDPRFFLYFEEVDWFLRAASAGWRARYVPEALVVHQGGASSAQVPRLAHLYFAQSKRAFYGKHFGPIAGLMVHTFTLLSYLLRALEDTGKLLIGHRAAFRRHRIALFLSVLQQAARR